MFSASIASMQTFGKNIKFSVKAFKIFGVKKKEEKESGTQFYSRKKVSRISLKIHFMFV